MSETSKRCSTCKFHDTVLGGDKTIQTICRKNPPHLLTTFVPTGPGAFTTMQANIWPNMKPDDWCGEYQAQLN